MKKKPRSLLSMIFFHQKANDPMKAFAQYDKVNDPPPDFEKIPKQHSFTVPEGYFERLSMNITDRIQAKSALRTKTAWYSPALRPVPVGVFLLIIAVTSLSIYFSQVSNRNHTSLLLADSISLREIIVDNSLMLSEMNENLLVETLEKETSGKQGKTSQVLFDNKQEAGNDENFELIRDYDISTNDLVNYMIDENINVESLY